MTNPDAKALIEKHLNLVDLVVAVERKKLGIRDEVLEEDLHASAMVGLVSAVDKYDPNRKESFKSYAEMRMRYAIYDGLASFGWFPRRLQRKIKFLRRASEMTHYQSQNPPPKDSTEAVHRLSDELKDLAAAYVTTYVEETKDSSSVPPEAEETAAQQELATRVRCYVESLPSKQRFVVENYFFKDLKLTEIAEKMGVTTSWASKLLTAGLRRLREMMESQAGTEGRAVEP